LGSIRPRTGRGELDLVQAQQPIRRRHANESIDATGICNNRLNQHSIQIEPDSPTLQPQFVEVEYLVEVGVEPCSAVQTAGTGDSSDVDRDACAPRLRGIVPRYDGGVVR